MRETEIRGILTQVCRELDHRARRSAGAAMLGASLLVTAGCSDPLYGAPDPPRDSGTTHDSGDADLDPGAVAEYMGPPVDSGSALDAGAQALYMAVEAPPLKG
jgi:hypothetical protein